MASRIYCVKSKDTSQCYLVRADNKSQAMRAVAEKTYTSEVAEQDTLVELVGNGMSVLDARQPQQELAGPGGA